MVDHQDVRAFCSHTGFIEGACASCAPEAGLQLTAFIFSRKSGPDHALSQAVQVDLAPVSAAAALQPDQHLTEHTQFINVFGTASAHQFEPAGAKIVVSSLQYGGFQVNIQCLDQVRDVFFNQLVLQCDRIS